jgi:acetyltransferase-like isoleucine patch superfamily enzyme
MGVITPIFIESRMSIVDTITSNPRLKAIASWLLSPPNQARPRLWVRLLVNPFVHHKGKHSRICFSVRKDLFPFRKFTMGSNSTVEDFATLNNGVGDITIGNNTRIGIGCVLIGPVTIGNDIRLAQNVVCSGLNHSYQDISIPIWRQAVTTASIIIGDESWIGSNSVIVAGVTIGKHSVVAAGSVVTRSIPDYCVAGGNPAKVFKQYQPDKNEWTKPNTMVNSSNT